MRSKLMLAAAMAALAVSAVAAQAAPSAAVVAAVADKARPANDTKDDANRKPAEMMEFAGAKAGQTVIDISPGGGYFTRVFSKVVGPKGVVYAVGSPPRAPQDPSKPPQVPAADTIAADPNFSNVKSLHATPVGQGVHVPTQADIAWTSRNYHDFKNAAPNGDMTPFNKSVFDALKPGGEYIVLDHAAASGAPAEVTRTLHRIDPGVVRKEVEAAGFKYEGESTALRNPADDHTGKNDESAVQGRTDQFIYKFRKPK